MIKIEVNLIVPNYNGAVVGTVTKEEMIKSNLAKILSKDDLLKLIPQLNKPPHTVIVFYPFKQFITKIQLSKDVNVQRGIVLYNCKNDLSIAQRVCDSFTEWDDSAKEMFMSTFYTVLANYNKDDLAELQVVQ